MELGVPEVRTACCSSHSLVRPPVEWDRSGAVRAPLWDAHSTWCHLRASGGGLMRQTATLASRHCVTYYRSAVRFQISCGQVCFRGTIRAFASTTTIGAPSVRRSIRSCRRFSWSCAGTEGISSSTRGQRFRPIHAMSSAAFSLSGMASSLAAAIRICDRSLEPVAFGRRTQPNFHDLASKPAIQGGNGANSIPNARIYGMETPISSSANSTGTAVNEAAAEALDAPGVIDVADRFRVVEQE